jgi:hypothetical protein
MEKLRVGDIIKLKLNSELRKRYFFSKKASQPFIILSLSINEIMAEEVIEYNLKLISLIEFLKFRKSLTKNYINITGLPPYNSKNFYKIDRRLILEKKEDYFINKIMSR